MGIAVHCPCGKKFKVKDAMGGKAIRCPECKEPLRIPECGGESGTAAGRKGGGLDLISEESKEKAILRLEETRKRKQSMAEEEAAQRVERNKLIESYDQLTGKADKKGRKKTGELTSGKRRKATVIMKIADAGGTVGSTLAFKYIAIVLIFSGAVAGIIVGGQWAISYMGEESGPQKPVEERIADLYVQADKAIEAKRWGEANRCLNEILQLNHRLEVHIKFRTLRKRLDEGFEGD